MRRLSDPTYRYGESHDRTARLDAPAPRGGLFAEGVERLPEVRPAHAGSSAGDFGVIALKDVEGWVVTGHHNDALT
ncbi:hypothetical protein GCM10017779_62410 [Streptomyces capillispiralis]|nr:hypothetical protein GCM10017779_62410 [Streptomyces capillispiralis]